MRNYISVDTGTTNTRIHLVQDSVITQKLHFPVGARNGITDRTLLPNTLRQGIHQLLRESGLKPADICRVLASGMITSEFGLVDLPHVVAPAGVKQLHESMYETVLSEITEIPFAFIRGVKTDCRDLAHADMMRGEETEIMGLGCRSAGIYILPGSHSKLIQTNAEGAITDFRTMLTGEMIAALSGNTILNGVVWLGDWPIDAQYLEQGYTYAEERGINEALFKVRILKNLFGKTEGQIYNFFMGIILCDEIRSILAAEPEQITIAGKKAIKEAMAILLRSRTAAPVEVIEEDRADTASVFGAIRIFEYRS